MESLYILQQLSNIFGPSGYEDEVLRTIAGLLGKSFKYIQTPHKNLIVIPGYRKKQVK